MGGAPQLIELGWVLAGELDAQEREAALDARQQLLERLQRELPEFTWRMPLIQRRRLVQEASVEPVALLELGASEREARHWDFAVVVTDAELRSYYTPYAHGMPARALGTAVVSLAYLEPALREGHEVRDCRERFAWRVEKLVMHLLGHLNGVPHNPERASTMCEVGTAADLDLMVDYLPEELPQLREELKRVADLRVEERPDRPRSAPDFYLQVAWASRRDLLSGLTQLAPWRFPMRFARLTVAAMSALLILVITAESWDLGMRQSPVFIALFAPAVVLASSFFVVQRQRLLVRRPTKRLTEQSAVANITLVSGVVMGMFITWALLFLFILGFTLLLFRPELVQEWATSLRRPPTLGHYATFAGFAATFGIAFGALGASFETRSYFRHVAYVDGET